MKGNRIVTVRVHYMMGHDCETYIMVYHQPKEGWEVYFKREKYPWLFAFGLPDRHTVAEVFAIADFNIEQYGEAVFDD